MAVIGIYQKEGDKVEIKTTIGNKTEITYWSKGKFALFIVIFYLVITLVLWAIIRYFVNRGSDKAKREREREIK